LKLHAEGDWKNARLLTATQMIAWILHAYRDYAWMTALRVCFGVILSGYIRRP
jgi:hypothetical protein